MSHRHAHPGSHSLDRCYGAGFTSEPVWRRVPLLDRDKTLRADSSSSPWECRSSSEWNGRHYCNPSGWWRRSRCDRSRGGGPPTKSSLSARRWIARVPSALGRLYELSRLVLAHPDPPGDQTVVVHPPHAVCLGIFLVNRVPRRSVSPTPGRHHRAATCQLVTKTEDGTLRDSPARSSAYSMIPYGWPDTGD